MIKNYLNTTYRSALKNKMLFLTKIIGLAIGLAISILILQSVVYEINFDRFHEDGDRIYRLEHDSYFDGKHAFHENRTVRLLGPTLKDDFPEVEEICRLTRFGGGVVNYREEVLLKTKELYFADPSFFKMFSFPLIKGDPATALTQPFCVVISQSAAKKIFKDEDPVGKTFRFDWYNGASWLMNVKGVFKDIPTNSHLKFDFLFSNDHILKWWPMKYGWRRKYFYTYIKLAANTDPTALEAKLPAFLENYIGADFVNENRRDEYYMQPLKDIYLHSTANWSETARKGDLHSLYVMAILAMVILFISWANYINLSTISAIDRAREVGVRKVVGASRRKLVIQFLFESLILNVLATGIAVLLVILFTSHFNQFFGLQYTISLLNISKFWIYILGLLVVGTVLSGTIPALVLSSPQPSYMVKGKSSISTSFRGIGLRKTLVILQFIISIGLLAVILTFYQQLKFMRKQDTGMKLDQVVLLERPLAQKDIADFEATLNTFIDELKTHSTVSYASNGTVPGVGYRATHTGVYREGSEDAAVTLKCCWVNYDYLDVFQIPLVVGRNFSREYVTDKKAGLILNEKAVKLLGFKSPAEALDKMIYHEGASRGTVIGVVKDYHHESFKKHIEPVMFRFPHFLGSRYFAIKLNTDNYHEALDFIKKTWDMYFPGNQFIYHHQKEFFDRQYDVDRQFEKKLVFFTLFTVFIACLGLLGLSSYSTSQRTREVGIRKVYGASVSNIVVLFLKDVVKLFIIAVITGFPIAYLIVGKMLEKYAYRTEIGWWFFVIPLLIIIPIILSSVIYRIVKAARGNPVDALRYE